MTKKGHALILPGCQSGLKFLEHCLPCWEVFLSPPQSGWTDPTLTPTPPGCAEVLGNLDLLFAQMAPGFQGLVEHVLPAKQVLTSTFHPLPVGLGAPAAWWEQRECSLHLCLPLD